MATKKKFIGEAAATEILKKIADNHELNLSTRDMAHEARQGAEAALGLIDDLNTTKGKANGLATLDSAGKVPEAQVPPCILEFDTKAAFPATGKVNKIYVSKNDNKTWRWNGTAYVEISASIALGETSSTAYAGNKGKANADAIAAINNSKAKANGLATLDANGKLSSSQLPLGTTANTAFPGDKGAQNVEDITDLNIWKDRASEFINEANQKLLKIGKPDGMATLDSTGKVPEAQVPPCILEFDTKAAFPATGKVNKIYVSKNDNKTWRWNGTAYVEISASIALGETSSTAYAGNKGKANADAIASLNTWKSTASSDISTLKTWKTSASSDISTAKTDISSLKTKVSALEGVTYVEMTAAEIDAIYNELATA